MIRNRTLFADFLEMNRALGFHSLISVESFRTPNFPLVAELLVWLVRRFDSDVNIPLQIATEDERVQLIRNVAQFMVSYLLAELGNQTPYISCKIIFSRH